jgi:hypothetical protein
LVLAEPLHQTEVILFFLQLLLLAVVMVALMEFRDRLVPLVALAAVAVILNPTAA